MERKPESRREAKYIQKVERERVSYRKEVGEYVVRGMSWGNM